jgi:type IV pilus assembly protein PilA
MALPRRGDSIFSNRGFTLIELLIVCGIIGVIAAMCVSYLVRARLAANEASAIGTLKAVNSAQAAYSSACGKNAYAPTFARLVTGGFGSPDLNLASKSGYTFVMTAGTGGAGVPDCAAQPTQTAYYVTGLPVSAMSTGRRGFATNMGGTIWQDDAGAAPPEPFVVGGTVRPIQ